MAPFRLRPREKWLLGSLAVMALLLPRYQGVMVEASFLHWAAKEGSTLEVRLGMLVFRADVDRNDGKTPFEHAVDRDRGDVVKIMLESGVPPDRELGTGLSALSRAAGKGNAEMVEILLAAGADPAPTGRRLDGSPIVGPMHEAARHGHLDILKRLMAGRLPPRCEFFVASVHAAALESNRTEIVDYLLSFRDPEQDLQSLLDLSFALGGRVAGVALLEHLLKIGARIDARDEGGETALHHAVRARKIDVVEFLLARGLPVDVRNSSGTTPLFEVNTFPELDAGMAEALIARGANLDIVGAHEGLLHRAINYRSQVFLEFLLAHRADPNVMHPNWGAPLHTAASHGLTAAVRALLEAKADVTSVTEDGETPLHRLGVHSHDSPGTDVAACGRMLIEAGAPVTALSAAGRTVFHTSRATRYEDLTRAIRAAGLDPNVRDAEGNTALHVLCGSYLLEADMVRNLLASGADPAVKNGGGLTAVDILDMRKGHHAVEESRAMLTAPR